MLNSGDASLRALAELYLDNSGIGYSSAGLGTSKDVCSVEFVPSDVR